MYRLNLLFIFTSLISLCHAADEWPQFRGPDGQGHADNERVPLTWSESTNVAWKTVLPGEGHSSPVISENQIWLTTAEAKPLSAEEEAARLSKIKNPRGLKLAGALSLNAVLVDRESGQVLRRIRLFDVESPEPKHSLNSYASPTPVISGDTVYCHFGTYGTAAVDRRSGKVLWRQADIHVDHQNGPGSSPVVWKDRLILHFDGIDQQFLCALNCADGSLQWKTERSGKMDPKPEFQKAYATPLVVNAHGKPVLVSPAANWVYGYDPETGKEIWKASYGKLGFSTVPRPVANEDTVFISTSFLQPRLLAVDFTGQGDVTSTHIRWTSDRQAPKKPSLLLVNGRLYSVVDNGIAACLDAASGSEIWRLRLKGDFSASPLFAGGHIYFFGHDGGTTVVEDTGDEGRIVARNMLDGSLMASPAVADGALYLRTDMALYCIRAAEAP